MLKLQRGTFVILILALVTHVLLGVYAAYKETPTVDEYVHVPAGLTYWKYKNFSLSAKTPPLARMLITAPVHWGLAGEVNVPTVEVSPMGWGPWLYGHQFEKLNAPNYLKIFFISRLIVLLFSMLTAVLIFLWLRQSVGELIAAVAASGFLLSNSILAHAHLATVDIVSTFFIFLFAFLISRSTLNLKSATQCGLALGLALATKTTAVFMIPLFVFRFWRGWKVLTIGLLISLLTVHLTYGFKKSLPSRDDFQFTSNAFVSTLAKLPSWWPIPLPFDYVAGFDAQTADTEQGEFGSYLLGEWSNTGWWYYNFIALAVKEHLLTILLLLSSLVLVRNHTQWKWILVPMALIAIPMTFLNTLQLGIRYLLPIFPFLYLIVGLVLKELQSRLPEKVWVAATATLVLSWFFSSLTTSPGHLSYFNFAATSLAEKEEILLDSNLDWGQDLYRIPEIQTKFSGLPFFLIYFGHVSPSIYGVQFQIVPPTPVQGIVVVSANFWKGISYLSPAPDGSLVPISKGHLNWLANFKPIERVGSLLVFDTRVQP